MSDLEVAGVAASILQIAEIGFKLSVSLYNLYHKLQSANQNLRSLSSDISLTCNVLQQLGSALKQDEQARLCSLQALSTAKDVLEECKRAFQRIDDAVRASSVLLGMNLLERAFRFAFVLKESELDALHGNLESLKSTILLMLNVLMYAGQIQNRSASSSVLLIQQDLIKELIQERRINQIQESEFTGARMRQYQQHMMIMINRTIKSQTPTRTQQSKWRNTTSSFGRSFQTLTPASLILNESAITESGTVWNYYIWERITSLILAC